jgi:inosine-uridine nucleoside N-ribohydrolase
MLFHIDTDMGVDDALALVVASRLPPVSVVALSTVFGNVQLQTATRNAFLFRHLLCATWPIFAGAPGPSQGEWRDASNVHGDDGLGMTSADPAIATEIDAASHQKPRPLAELARPAEPLTIIALGPATNIPEIVNRYGKDHVAHIVLMGGVFFDRGNVSPTAEFNAACDPASLRATLAIGVPTTIVPLDVCRKVQLSRQTMRGYDDGSRLMRVLVNAHMHYMDQYRDTEAIDGCFPHDALAVLVAAYPDRFWHLRGHVTVADDATTRLTEDQHSSVRVVTGGDLAFVRNALRTLDFRPVPESPSRSETGEDTLPPTHGLASS